MALRFKTKEELIAEFGEENWRQSGKSTFFTERMDVVLGKPITDPIITDFNFKDPTSEDSRGTFNIKGEGGPWAVRRWMLTEAPLLIGAIVESSVVEPGDRLSYKDLQPGMEVEHRKIGYKTIGKAIITSYNDRLYICGDSISLDGCNSNAAQSVGKKYAWCLSPGTFDREFPTINLIKAPDSDSVVSSPIDYLGIGATVRFIRKHERFNAPKVYYTDHSHAIPKELIIRGDFCWKENQGKVVAIHKDYYIVNYMSERNKPVQLGFKAEDIEVVSSVQSISHKPKTNNEKSSNNGIKVPRFIGTITSGKRVAGNSVQGRRIRATISIGHLSNAQINSYR